ncbi:MAG: Gfo/Idh/MocA family oxidoreductase [Candidatus Bipolaricaulota bacterium]|nr:Gfo/Idh/MocA family oxidoreductase [Candidatus Bipolaricaulota bacterium]
MKGVRTREIRVAIVGTKFMGRAHANAYRQARAFFSLPISPSLSLACGTNEGETQEFARQFGFARYTTRWEEAATATDVDLVDICAPNDLHAPITAAAAKAGKAVFCEKPLARNLEEAKNMCKAVAEARVPNMICFNYRFFPAIQLAKKLIADGALGEIRQFHALYLQDWGLRPGLPLTWRFQKERAGSGALGDTAVHIVDLARFLVGEIAEVTRMLTTFGGSAGSS